MNYCSLAEGKSTICNGIIDRFPMESGIEEKLRDITETWHPVCVARRLRSLRRLIFSATKRAFWESVIDATATVTPLPQDEYEVRFFEYICIDFTFSPYAFDISV